MKFLSIYKTPERNTPPTQDEMSRMMKLIGEMTRSGALVATEGCLPSVAGARIRKSGSAFTVTDGPFTEAKEVIGGFAILQAASKAEALELVKTFLEVAGDGECELRQIFEPSTANAREAAALQAELAGQYPGR